MKVFISWSGEPSKQIAAALYEWLPLVTQEVEPFFSDQSIEAGSSWMEGIAEELQGSLGVICLTPNNLAAPWLYFEAGALSKALSDSKVRVMPLLHGMDFADVGPPLSRFNMIRSDADGIQRMCATLNQASRRPLTTEHLSRTVNAFLPELLDKLGSLPVDAAATNTHRDDRAVLEEILSSVRDMQSGRLQAYEELVNGLLKEIVAEGGWTAQAERRGLRLMYPSRAGFGSQGTVIVGPDPAAPRESSKKRSDPEDAGE